MTITVTHYPTSASKWNPVEHRLFGSISGNWAGQPLSSFETAFKFIRTTRTETGLRCRARLDTSEYATGLKVTKEQKALVRFGRRRILQVQLHHSTANRASVESVSYFRSKT